MIRKLILLPAAAILALAACSTVTDETLSSIVVNGEIYHLRTRTIDGPNGSFKTSSVSVKNKYHNCIPSSPGDCEAAVQRGLETTINDR